MPSLNKIVTTVLRELEEKARDENHFTWLVYNHPLKRQLVKLLEKRK